MSYFWYFQVYFGVSTLLEASSGDGLKAEEEQKEVWRIYCSNLSYQSAYLPRNFFPVIKACDGYLCSFCLHQSGRNGIWHSFDNHFALNLLEFPHDWFCFKFDPVWYFIIKAISNLLPLSSLRNSSKVERLLYRSVFSFLSIFFSSFKSSCFSSRATSADVLQWTRLCYQTLLTELTHFTVEVENQKSKLM